MARIVQQGVITTSGVSYENEPIIKSDGDGEVMQWIPSDGVVADGITIDEPGATNPLRLGIGTISPEAPLHISKDENDLLVVQRSSSAGASQALIRFVNSAGTNVWSSYIGSERSGAALGNLVFGTGGSSEGGVVERMRIDSAGLVKVGSVGTALADLHVFGASGVPGVAWGQLALTSTSDLAANVGGSIIFGGKDTASTYDDWAGIAGLKENATSGQDGGYLAFYTKTNGGSATERMRITSTGAVTIPATGSFTIGSLDIGHGLGGATSNTAVGKDALVASHSGSINNTAIGDEALNDLNADAGDYNTMIGAQAGAKITSGHENVAVGYAALDATLTGNFNTGIGINALTSVCVDDNTAVGANALYNFTGSDATAVGSGAADAAVACADLTAVGKNALGAMSHADAEQNTAVGSAAAAALVGASGAGKWNTVVGAYALTSSVDGTGNTAIGRTALYGGDCANDNTAIGQSALSAFTGSDATAVGSGAADVAGSQSSLTAIGKDALGAATSGNNNTAVGAACLDATVYGHSNTAVGTAALSAVCANANTAVGYAALNLFTGSEATVVGYQAANAATSATHLTAVGSNALGSLTIGLSNTAVGYGSLTTNLTTGDYNTAVGHAAGQDVYGDHNMCVGFQAGQYASDVDHCIAIGSSALRGPASFTERLATHIATRQSIVIPVLQ